MQQLYQPFASADAAAASQDADIDGETAGDASEHMEAADPALHGLLTTMASLRRKVMRLHHALPRELGSMTQHLERCRKDKERALREFKEAHVTLAQTVAMVTPTKQVGPAGLPSAGV